MCLWMQHEAMWVPLPGDTHLLAGSTGQAAGVDLFAGMLCSGHCIMLRHAVGGDGGLVSIMAPFLACAELPAKRECVCVRSVLGPARCGLEGDFWGITVCSMGRCSEPVGGQTFGSESFWFCGLDVCGSSLEAYLESNHSVWGDDSFMLEPQPQLSVHACQLVGQQVGQPTFLRM